MSEPTQPPRVTSAGRIQAFYLLDAATSIPERQLFALVDAVSCAIDHDRYGGIRTARLALEAVVAPATARDAIAALIGEDDLGVR